MSLEVGQRILSTVATALPAAGIVSIATSNDSDWNHPQFIAFIAAYFALGLICAVLLVASRLADQP